MSPDARTVPAAALDGGVHKETGGRGAALDRARKLLSYVLDEAFAIAEFDLNKVSCPLAMKVFYQLASGTEAVAIRAQGRPAFERDVHAMIRHITGAERILQ